jgi:alkanesulfonate monooxygenase SsuD/methylene tetrahydromethanopterin reductase-like flavin-dependent oxidoreductase (luciferase family)
MAVSPSSTVLRKRIGFLSFGHWSQAPGSQTRTAGDALTQTVELAVGAEALGIDGAYVRVHHFARQFASPFPLLAAMGARTSTIELGTGVIDMRYENPLYMAEEAAAADLLSAGRLQLGVSRGSPEPAVDGAQAFGHVPRDGETDADLARRHTARFREAIAGVPQVDGNRQMGAFGRLAIEPQAPGLADRIWWGAGSFDTAEWAARAGMNLMSSTLLLEERGIPFDELQAEQILRFRDAWVAAGHEREPRVSVSRSVFPITSDEDAAYFGREAGGGDTVGVLDGATARFGKTYAGAPDVVAEQLAKDAAVGLADTVLLTIPNQLGVAYNLHVLGNVAEHVAPAIGWTPAAARPS